MRTGGRFIKDAMAVEKSVVVVWAELYPLPASRPPVAALTSNRTV